MSECLSKNETKTPVSRKNGQMFLNAHLPTYRNSYRKDSGLVEALRLRKTKMIGFSNLRIIVVLSIITIKKPAENTARIAAMVRSASIPATMYRKGNKKYIQGNKSMIRVFITPRGIKVFFLHAHMSLQDGTARISVAFQMYSPDTMACHVG
jgi:hypothetical protein